MRTVKAITVGLIILLVGIGAVLYYTKQQGIVSITTFKECQTAGYPVDNNVPPQCETPDGRIFVGTVATSTNNIPTATSSSSANLPDKIRVKNIVKDQLVTSPLAITGEARGNWYFEAVFPIELIDGNGKRLAQGLGTAVGEWMTTAFVPFTSTLSFSKPTTATGTLILRNDNPSGLPENAFELRIPIRFSEAE